MVPNQDPAKVTDLGCGPGNLTELLVARFPAATVSGMDPSPQMIEAARKRLPSIDFSVSRIERWVPAKRQDVIFAKCRSAVAPGPWQLATPSPQRIGNERNAGDSNAGQFE
ncbi:methyltransferase domain-containing protein [Mesorhizobium prunaredense]|uniref:methyltransferase domain-containing protein n=1 Tax=Mesorhizobium prunaredense TaxID=1631249 RepID=UPI001FCCFA0F|nr:methyltransferase domain-containing protein [Mesorhizobium prunaredense]